MDYCFGAGDGVVTAWDAPLNADLDGDGVLDAVRLDFDGDGLFDDMMWDSDADGSADHSVLDVDNDGVPETFFTDEGLGTWTFHVERSGSISWFGLDGTEHAGGAADLDGDGTPEQLVDVDGDGDAERAFRATDSGTSVYADTTGDGRWDVELTDADGDGTADAARALAPPRPSAADPIEGPS
ncbi:pullulanase [Mycobacterium sp. CBMA271]|uniref:pullulanase n=1 Tax=unclassified Mycobacteroides TaxID=2618759 RepID=UPI0012DF958A|nr:MULTISPECIES: pullulanase [unclassified Mycobacteroides]MUM17090.1 pullulanase [Mycobacteroides sp. CBMA 326]MUM23328.1 pullulanase [Mycobacteroides sp. CBMA 271]